jgi:hypothetical protein
MGDVNAAGARSPLARTTSGGGAADSSGSDALPSTLMAHPTESLSRALMLFEENPYPEDRARRVVVRSEAVTRDELTAVEHDLGWLLPQDYQSLITSVGPFHVLKDRGESYELELLGPRRGREAWSELSAHMTRWLPAPPFDAGASTDSSLFVATREYDGNRRFGCLFYARAGGLYTFHEKDGIDRAPDSALGVRLVELVTYLAGWDECLSQWVES